VRGWFAAVALQRAYDTLTEHITRRIRNITNR
jgi:hypothetical protein